MNNKIVFIPPICKLVVITPRIYNKWKLFEIIRQDGKKYIITWINSSYDNKNKLFTIKSYWKLPVIIEIEKEYIINNKLCESFENEDR